VRYHCSWSSEGNSVAKWNGDWGIVDTSVEVGTPIRITHRIIARSKDLISPYHCVIQYKRLLKIERYDEVQVVLLSSLSNSHQRVDTEVILKYGVRDNTSDSLVFCCSKDNGAGGNPLSETIYKP
tara:strand:+ start:219 stop:593 length:375 start_codon:yes stop_codon:yes gene_type:complete